MNKINFSDNIFASGRNLYLQTSTLEGEEKMVSTLFDGGRVLEKASVFFDPALSEERLYHQVEAFHQERKQALEFIFSISARVKTVRHPRSLVKLAGQFLKWNLIDEAISELEFALQYDKNIADIYILLASAYEKRGVPEESVRTLQNAVTIFPKYADLWKDLSEKQSVLGKWDSAEESIEKALKINPNYSDAHLIKSFLLSRKQEVLKSGTKSENQSAERLQRHLNRLVQSEKFRSAELDNAVRFCHNEEWQSLTKQLEFMIRNIPKTIDFDFHDLFYLQYLYGEQGKNAKSINDYVSRLESFIQKFPKFADLHNMLGIGYLIQCRLLFSKALHQFRIACKLNPDYERAKSNLKLAENDGKGFLILLRAMLK